MDGMDDMDRVGLAQSYALGGLSVTVPHQGSSIEVHRFQPKLHVSMWGYAPELFTPGLTPDSAWGGVIIRRY